MSKDEFEDGQGGDLFTFVNGEIAPAPKKRIAQPDFGLIGLAATDVEFYRKLFIPPVQKYRISRGLKSDGKSMWYEVKKYISDTLLFDHFIGKFPLSGFTGNTTSRLVLDLDIGADIIARYKLVIDAIGLPSFLLQSSNRSGNSCPLPGGLHLTYLSEKACNTRMMAQGVKNFLESKGIMVKGSYVEILPDIGNSLRLPLIADNYLPNVYSYYPNGNHLLQSNEPSKRLTIDEAIPTFAQSLAYMRTAPQYDLSHFLEYADKPRVISVSHGSNYDPSKEKVLRNNPVTSGTRNDFWLEWVQDLSKRGMTDDEIYNCIINRMGSPEWNKGSVTWFINQADAEKHLKKMLARSAKREELKIWHRPKKQLKKDYFTAKVPLSEKEIGFIIQNTLSEDGTYDFRMQIFLFNLMGLLKEKLSRGVFELPILSCIFTWCRERKARDNNKKYTDLAQKIGILTMTKPPQFKEGELGTAASYSINENQFDMQNRKYIDLHEAIRSFFKERMGEFQKCYSRVNRRHILGGPRKPPRFRC